MSAHYLKVSTTITYGLSGCYFSLHLSLFLMGFALMLSGLDWTLSDTHILSTCFIPLLGHLTSSPSSRLILYSNVQVFAFYYGSCLQGRLGKFRSFSQGPLRAIIADQWTILHRLPPPSLQILRPLAPPTTNKSVSLLSMNISLLTCWDPMESTPPRALLQRLLRRLMTSPNRLVSLHNK